MIMKTQRNINLWLVAWLALSISIVSCSTNQSKESVDQSDLGDEKQKLEQRLEQAKVTIEKSLSKLEEKANLEDGSVEQSLEVAKGKLEKQKAKLDETISLVQKSVEADWTSVKDSAETTLSETKSALTAIKKEIKTSWEEITENNS